MAVRRTQFATGSSGRKSLRGIGLILTDYKRFKDKVDDEVETIMEGAANIVLENTIPLTPEATGALRSSGRAFAIRTLKGLAGVVTFGGPENPVTPTPNAPSGIVNYAVMVHEDLERQYAVGGPKYLERGGIVSKQEVDEYVLSELRKIKP
jgi:hypothetical protein